MMQDQLFLNSLSATDANKHYTHTIPSSSLIRESENVQEMKSAAILSGELSREKTAGVCKQTTQQLCSSAQGVLFRLFKHTDTLVSRQSKPAISTHPRRALLGAYTALAHDSERQDDNGDKVPHFTHKSACSKFMAGS